MKSRIKRETMGENTLCTYHEQKQDKHGQKNPNHVWQKVRVFVISVLCPDATERFLLDCELMELKRRFLKEEESSMRHPHPVHE